MCSVIVYGIKHNPSTTVMKLRNLCYRYLLKSMGNSNIVDGVTIMHPEKVSIGDRVSILQNVYILGEVTIGNYVGIGANCSLIGEAHNTADISVPWKKQGMIGQPS
jgi:bifunctional N-acetylglucosamine-1-phosphate-uridyltransferase/glucosamine-1-phosphate-acetyltransferase GlmU-like protein